MSTYCMRVWAANGRREWWVFGRDCLLMGTPQMNLAKLMKEFRSRHGAEARDPCPIGGVFSPDAAKLRVSGMQQEGGAVW